MSTRTAIRITELLNFEFDALMRKASEQRLSGSQSVDWDAGYVRGLMVARDTITAKIERSLKVNRHR